MLRLFSHAMASSHFWSLGFPSCDTLICCVLRSGKVPFCCKLLFPVLLTWPQDCRTTMRLLMGGGVSKYHGSASVLCFVVSYKQVAEFTSIPLSMSQTYQTIFLCLAKFSSQQLSWCLHYDYDSTHTYWGLNTGNKTRDSRQARSKEDKT